MVSEDLGHGHMGRTSWQQELYLAFRKQGKVAYRKWPGQDALLVSGVLLPTSSPTAATLTSSPKWQALLHSLVFHTCSPYSLLVYGYLRFFCSAFIKWYLMKKTSSKEDIDISTLKMWNLRLAWDFDWQMKRAREYFHIRNKNFVKSILLSHHLSLFREEIQRISLSYWVV